ncbi:CAP domain-containing protein [Waterburya agarophytonicola K14]|uniref:CAP domain-containing protein n=1 Tax=Waterburya agarophytonicola KI4 TaxID=2874699 RepID=A0A964FI25_9CYAN|nr:CAP domain-containing protein [Waterburya agarophytonicola]MCC0177988.1 CAP domain-containing protein [Waterburya agarophytonicola KI4]
MSARERELSRLAELVHQKVNQYRASKNLAPLKLNNLISKQAKIHSVNMAQQKVAFSHDGFSARAQAIENNIDYRTVAENVAYNMGYQDPVSKAIAGWIESDGHRKNMEGNYNLTGIGVAVNPAGEYYFTQIFILEN